MDEFMKKLKAYIYANPPDFTSCEEALKFIQSNPADIAFLDINMRGMGGLSLAEKKSFVLIARSYFAPVMRSTQFLLLSFMPPAIR